MALKCPKCGKLNPDNARFCWNDGEKLVTTGFTPFQFTSGSSANSIEDLIVLIEQNWSESKRYLYSGSFATWFSSIGRGDLTLAAQDVVQNNRDEDIGLEKFLQSMGSDAPPNPQLTVSPVTLDFGTVDAEKVSKGGYTKQFTIRNAGRGHLYGTITSSESWVATDKTEFSGNSTTITATVQAVGRSANITIQSNGGTETLPVKMNPVYPIWKAILSFEALIGAVVGFLVFYPIAYAYLISAPNVIGIIMGMSFGLVISMSRWARKNQRPAFYLIPVALLMLGIGTPTYVGYQEYKIRKAVKTGDARAVEPFIKTLIKALKSKRSRLRERAAIILGGTGDARVVDPLIDALKDKDFSVRRCAALSLGIMGAARAVTPLINALKDENWDVRRLAAFALGNIGDARAVEPLIDALKDGDLRVHGTAAWALGKISDARAIEPLINALKDENWDVRRRAAYALGKIGDARAIGPLNNALEDNDEGVRQAAKEALEKIQKR